MLRFGFLDYDECVCMAQTSAYFTRLLPAAKISVNGKKCPKLYSFVTFRQPRFGKLPKQIIPCPHQPSLLGRGAAMTERILCM
jgi:hypothetical protein